MLSAEKPQLEGLILFKHRSTPSAGPFEVPGELATSCSKC